jgi:hypothetical protein
MPYYDMEIGWFERKFNRIGFAEAAYEDVYLEFISWVKVKTVSLKSNIFLSFFDFTFKIY